MKNALLTFLFLASSWACIYQANAQQLLSSIRGTVTDIQTQQPLIGATVTIVGTDPLIGTTTDVFGNYVLKNVPIGRVSIQVQYLGYEKRLLENIELNSGKELVLNIGLEETIVRAQDVVIIADRDISKAQNELATVSARQLSIENSKRYAGSLNDVSRMAQNFAGVQGANDTRNDLVVRGNSSMGVLYRMEGMDIPNPNHFALMGSTGGPISILNNNVLENSDFFTGAFPAEYGNAYAGVFDLKMRNGSISKHEFLGQIGFNGIEAMAEGPLKKGGRGSYLVNYRYSTLEALKFLGVFFGTLAVPEYQDLSFKVNLPNSRGTTSIFGLGGVSQIAFLDEETDEDDIFVPGRRNLYYGTRMGAVGVSHVQFLGSKTFVKAILSTQYSANNILNDTLDTEGVAFNTYTNTSGQGKNSLGLILSHKFNSRHFLKVGGYFDRLFFDLNERFWSNRLKDFVQQSDFNGATYLLQPFAQWQFKYSKKLSINAGLHYQQFLLNQTTALEPRLGMRWNVSNRSTISMGYGRHSQLPPTNMYFAQLEGVGDERPNENLGFLRSDHFVLGYDYGLSPVSRIKMEVYYQGLSNVPVDEASSSYSVLNQGANFYFEFPASLVNEGTGENYGIEFTLERFLHRGFYYLVTASLFESKYTASNGETYNTAFNGNYNFTALAGYENNLFQRKHGSQFTFTSNARFTLNGGQRYTPIDLEASRRAGIGVLDESSVFGEQFDDYWRVDTRFGLKRNGHRVTHELAVELQNVTGRQNVFTVQYNPEEEIVEELYQLGFLPLLQYRLYF